ncbi:MULTISPECIES: SE1561 family protein [unclassified Exiguobacterium]|uniref:SE1561 family protein n=1 Tax=unclassified Exiguobacterium TaxID=2644629 RepID=UPI0025C61FE1|nr:MULTISPECIES: SE1561 family protein [unclassified Exiguobacterium]
MGKARTDKLGQMNVLKSRMQLLCHTIDSLDESSDIEDLERLILSLDQLKAKVVRYAKDMKEQEETKKAVD